MTKTSKPTNTKTSNEQVTEPQGDSTKLVENPQDMTSKEIKEVSKDDGTDKPENEANADMAEQLKEAKSGDERDVGYFGGQGGAAGI